jgi:hypothetical protein
MIYNLKFFAGGTTGGGIVALRWRHGGRIVAAMLRRGGLGESTFSFALFPLTCTLLLRLTFPSHHNFIKQMA